MFEKVRPITVLTLPVKPERPYVVLPMVVFVGSMSEITSEKTI